MSGWSDAVDEVLGGDQATVLAYTTPAGGVVCAPVTNFGQRDRAGETVTVNSSIGAPRKLERISCNPRVALAFHTRHHGSSDRSEYVLVQGTATLSEPIPDYPAVLGEAWDRFDGPRAGGPLWKWWLRVYYTRIEIQVAVDRVLVWTDLACSETPKVFGTTMPEHHSASQDPPAKGRTPRIDPVAAAARAARLPDVLLGWTGADHYPLVAPVGITGSDPDGIHLTGPAGLVPDGARRAGLTGHAFTRYVLGQHQRLHTGWLDAGPDRLRYAPHTQTGHHLPASQLVYRLAVGYSTRRRQPTRQTRMPEP